jgi:NAD(P)-dependent dehydrogenase (short-subunit alcohol dehydrogenase family)
LDITGGAAFVTGGASGIGSATVVALAERGASVVFVDRDEGAARQTMALTGHSDKVVFRACDVADGQDLAAAVDSAVERFGRLDLAVNVAGIGRPPDRRLVPVDAAPGPQPQQPRPALLPVLPGPGIRRRVSWPGPYPDLVLDHFHLSWKR